MVLQRRGLNTTTPNQASFSIDLLGIMATNRSSSCPKILVTHTSLAKIKNGILLSQQTVDVALMRTVDAKVSSQKFNIPKCITPSLPSSSLKY